MANRILNVPQIAHLFGLSLAGGVLLNLAWAPHRYTFLVFFSLVPFLWVARRFNDRPAKVFTALYAGFFVFHLLAGWWMYSSTLVGSLLAHLLNAFLPAAALTLWASLTNGRLQPVTRALLFIGIWLSMEWLNAIWMFAWPWFQLGHVFGERPEWVQWYRFTSSSGGSLWVLITNYLLFSLLNANFRARPMLLFVSLMVVTIPVLVSGALRTNEESPEVTRVAVVQPNIHPAREKFNGMDAAAQLQKALQLLGRVALKSVDYVVFPETMIVEPVDEDRLHENQHIRRIENLLDSLQVRAVLTGAFTSRQGSWHPADANKAMGLHQKEVRYNSLLYIGSDSIKIYHKEKLVPLVEKQPLLWLIGPFREFVERSGGFFGSYGTHNVSGHFMLENNNIVVPMICFESAFSCHPSHDARPGFVALVTNDGWWSSSGGYLQHLNLARIRAIERGQWIVRAANTGVSGLISPEGQLVASLNYEEDGVLVGEVGFRSASTISCVVQNAIRLIAFLILLAGMGVSFFARMQSLWQKKLF
ncbi:MAG: apolipoprotein N-acyltransferase [Bacteroidetes bacterium]|nr:apolipoprotein N-acyltransferase [Bacteroidota bacterium]